METTTQSEPKNGQGPQFESSEIEKVFDFTLTQEELADRGKAAGKLDAELMEIKGCAASVNKQWKGRIELKQGELSDVLETIRTGTEPRTVKCTIRKDFSKKCVQYIYKDKVLEERAMEPAELQLEIDDVPSAQEELGIKQ